MNNKQPYNCYFTNRLCPLGRQNRIQTQELSRLHHQRLLRDENDLHVRSRTDRLQRINVLQRQQVSNGIVSTSLQRAGDLLNGTGLRLGLVQHSLRLTMRCVSFPPITPTRSNNSLCLSLSLSDLLVALTLRVDDSRLLARLGGDDHLLVVEIRVLLLRKHLLQ